jgi:hypothetical protein
MTGEHLTDGWEPDLPVADTLLWPLPYDRPGATLDEVEGFFDGQGTGEAYLWSAWPTRTCARVAGSWRATRPCWCGCRAGRPRRSRPACGSSG